MQALMNPSSRPPEYGALAILWIVLLVAAFWLLSSGSIHAEEPAVVYLPTCPVEKSIFLPTTRVVAPEAPAAFLIPTTKPAPTWQRVYYRVGNVLYSRWEQSTVPADHCANGTCTR